MSRGRTLAVVTADRLDERAAEFLRIAVGLVAGGHDVAFRELGAGAGRLAERAPSSARPWVRVLVAEGVLAHDADRADGVGLRDALRDCGSVLRLGDAERTGVPAVLVIDDAYLDAASDEQLATDLASAGQVIRC